MAFQFDIDKSQLSAKHQQVLEIVERKGFKIAYMSIGDIAMEAGVSTATVSRFWVLMGFRNIKDFKNHVKKRIETTPENKLKNFMLDIGSDDLFDRVIEQHYGYLFQTHSHLSRKDLNASVSKIMEARKVFIHAPSSSEGLGSLLRHRLKRFGITVEKIAKSGHEIFESMIHFQPDDVIVIFQFVKLLPESKAILDYANELGIKTILFTDQLIADMNELADYVLYADRGDTWEFHSMVAPMTVVETLVMLVGQKLEEKSLGGLEKLSELRSKYGDIVPN
ncbi:MurR/RpiR family transcriptional regulator [Oceanobacillus sp. CAU 1775]